MQPTSNQKQLEAQFQLLPGEDLVGKLPREVSLMVFSYFNPHTLCCVAQVCKTWNKLTNHKTLWRKWAEHVAHTMPSSFKEALPPSLSFFTGIGALITENTSIENLKKIACIGCEKEIKTMNQLIDKVDRFFKKTLPSQNAGFICCFEQLKGDTFLSIVVRRKKNENKVDIYNKFYATFHLSSPHTLSEEDLLPLKPTSKYDMNMEGWVKLKSENTTHSIEVVIPIDFSANLSVACQKMRNRMITTIERLTEEEPKQTTIECLTEQEPKQNEQSSGCILS